MMYEGAMLAAMLGWCGTKWPGWWRGGPRPPQPGPWPLIEGIIGAIGGFAAWAVIGRAVHGEENWVAAMFLTAFFGGLFLATLVDALRDLAAGGKRSDGPPA